MNHENVNRASGAAIGFVIAFVIFLVLIAIAKFSISVPAIDADRDAAISKSFAEIRHTESVALANPDWVDQSRSIVRLPIETAMQITAKEWQNPSQARADLIAREGKLNAPAPTNAAPKANPFE
jgi:tetrahydromethanopterin S-methyltransferase subunit F